MGPVDLKRLVDLHTESDAKFQTHQRQLVTKICVRYALGAVHWLRS